MSLGIYHGVTRMDEGVVTHVQRSKGLSRKVGSPIMELVMMSRDAADVLKFQIMGD